VILSCNLNAHIYLKTVITYMKNSLRCYKHELPHCCSARMQKVVNPNVLYAVPLTVCIHMQFIIIKFILYLLNPMCQVTIIFLQMNFCVFLKKEIYSSV
jgi:hypothetical protein